VRKKGKRKETVVQNLKWANPKPCALCNEIITGFSSRYLAAAVLCMVKHSTVLTQRNDHVLRSY
jgi:hypothetical protein